MASFNGTNSKVENTTASGLNNDTFSILAWIYLVGFGEANLGRIINIDEGSQPFNFRVCNTASHPTSLQVEYLFDLPMAGEWKATTTALATDRWFCVAMTYDRTSILNDPSMWIRDTNTDPNLIAQSITEIATPVGAAVPMVSGYCIGNNSATSRSFNGRINCLQYWNRILTEGELQLASMRPGSVTNGLSMYFPLIGVTGEDLSGNVQNGTASNISQADGPPVSPLYSGFAQNYVTAAAPSSKRYYYQSLIGN